MSDTISSGSVLDSLRLSASEPDFSKIKNSQIPPSNRSTCSSGSSKSGKKKGVNVIPKGRKLSSSKSNLTEESLEEFNRRNEADAKKISNSSPYYRGLTDSTLIITRQRNSSMSSPGRDSFATAVTSGSILTVFGKIHEWGASCFKSHEDFIDLKNPVLTTTDSALSLLPSSSNSASVPMMSYVEEVGLERKESNSTETKTSSSLVQGKPLRERVSFVEAAKPSIVEKKVAVVEEMPKEAEKEERQFILADKYRPKALKDFICNRAKAEELQAMARNGECNHFIFEGLPGVGKRTMIWAFLKEAFGPDSLKTTEEYKEFELKGEPIGSIRVKVKESRRHIEINLSELRGYEKHVIVSLVKETSTIVENNAMKCDHTNCRAIILYEADMLSTDAQLYIRWLLERYRGCNKVFFCCSDASKLHPISTLCTVIKLKPPSNEKIVEVLEFIAKQEGIELTPKFAEKIAEFSKRNLRQAIRSFEASWQTNYPFKEDQEVTTGWEDDIANIAKNIIEEQSPRQLYIIRGKLQKLIEHNVSPDFIFKTLVGELKKHLDDQLRSKIDVFYHEFNRDNDRIFDGDKSRALHNRFEEDNKWTNDPVRKNAKHFMNIEEFTAKFMSFYKSLVMKNAGAPIGSAI